MWYHKTPAFIFGFYIPIKGLLSITVCHFRNMKKKFLDRITFVKSGQFHLFFYLFSLYVRGGFPGGANGKEPACQYKETQETWAIFLGQEDPLEEEMTTHSSILAWRIPWMEEPGGLHAVAQSQTRLNMHAHTHVLDTLVHVVSDFSLFSLWDMKVGRVRASLSLTAILNSVLWKYSKWLSDWLTKIREGNGKGSNIRRITYLETLATSVGRASHSDFHVMFTVISLCCWWLVKDFNWKILGSHCLSEIYTFK